MGAFLTSVYGGLALDAASLSVPEPGLRFHHLGKRRLTGLFSE